MIDFLKWFLRRRGLTPVSQALEVDASAIDAHMRRAIEAIDQVHTDGALPILPLKAALLPDMYGYFQNTTSGKAVEIVVNLVCPHVEVTTVHEIGHFLDLKGLDPAVPWASVNSAKLARWREAVKQSGAVQTLGHFLNPATRIIMETQGNGSVVEYAIDKNYAEYLLKAEELWARSYAQFIAAKSRDPALLQQIEQERSRPVNGLYYPKQWDEADFERILAEIETIFRGLRWIQ